MTLIPTADPYEAAARAFQKKTSGPRWKTPGELAIHLTRHSTRPTVQTPALELIDQELVNLGPGDRVIITMPPQEGKSTRVSHDYVLWLLANNPDQRVVGVSYAQDLATRNGRVARRSAPEAGLRLAKDNGSAAEWQIDGHEGGLFSVGIGGALTGRPADIMVIDDPIKDQEQADSPSYRDRVWDWWQTVGSARLAPDAAVVIILTRWHEDDLAGRLLKDDPELWRLVNIPAMADYRPDLGETDPLGREPGEYMVSARGRTPRQWEARRKEAGSRAWQALYQGRPSPDEGLVFNVVKDLRFWTRFPDKADRPNTVYLSLDDVKDQAHRSVGRIAESWDLTFTGEEYSDFVVGTRWWAVGSSRFLLHMQRGQWEFPQQIAKMKLWGKDPEWSGLTHVRLVEKAANGAAALATLKGLVGVLRPVKPTEAKESRAIAVTPQFEAGDVYLPHPEDPGNEWVKDVIEELRLFPVGTHDDIVDSISQFLKYARGWGQMSGVISMAQMRKELRGA